MKKRKDSLRAELLTTILILIGIAVIGWRLYPLVSNRAELSLSEVVAQASTVIPEEFSNITVNSNAEDTQDAGNIVIHQVKGYSFFTGAEASNDGSAQFELIDSMWRTDFGVQSEQALKKIEKEERDALQPVKHRIIDVLEDNGFSKADGYPDKAIYATLVFDRKDAVCNVDEYYGTIYLDCVAINELQKAAEQSELFAKVYREKYSKGDHSSNYFKLYEKGYGKTDADAYAFVDIGQLGAYFYQNADNEWVHYANSLEGLNCSDIKDQQAADAFASMCRPADAEGL